MNWNRLLRVVTIDRAEPPGALAFTVLLVLCAAVLLTQNSASLSNFSWSALPFVVLLSLAEITPVVLSRGEQRVSVSFTLVFAVAVIFEPVVAALIISVGAVLANWIQLKPVNIWLFNGAQFFLSGYLGSTAWHHIVTDPGGVTLWHHLPALAISAVALFIANIALTTVSVSLAYRLRPVDVFLDNIKWSAPNFFFLWTLGILVIVLYQGNGGLPAVLLLWMPLLVVRYSFQQYMELKESHLQTIQSLAATLDAKDPYTHGHSRRVAELAAKIARHFGLRQSEIDAIHYAGLLHDIGKIGIQDSILNKAGLLTGDELAVIRMHPSIGSDIVRHVKFLDDVAVMIRHHHEAYDGSGYPDGLSGEDIPLGARILCVADAFDAMTIDRVYRKGLTVEGAVRELQRGKGTQFDPKVVDVFVEHVVPELTARTERAGTEARKVEVPTA